MSVRLNLSAAIRPLFAALALAIASVVTAPALAAEPAAATHAAPGLAVAPLQVLGVGDTITIQVYGKPDLSTTTTVADDGSIVVPLIGTVAVLGLSPSQAASKIAQTYQDQQYLVNPQISITLDKATSQQVSVLGEVGAPGRYAVESRTSVFDLLALAGGKTVEGASVIFLVRTEANGSVSRTPINLTALSDPMASFPTVKLQGGDTLFVPRADPVFIYGEVTTPGRYALTPGMTLVQALTLAGGVTRRGSTSRIEIKRKKPDGSYQTLSPKLTDPLQADDVVKVKESIF